MNIIKEEDKEYGEDYFSKLSNDISNNAFKEEFNLIKELSYPREGDKVLDLGCGKGRAGLFILSLEKKCDVTFSDVTPTAKEYLSGYNFVQCSMTDTPFPDNTFDKIYSLSTISHIKNIGDAIREMHRISKGEILITTNNKWNVYIFKLASFFGLIPKLNYDGTAIKLYSRLTLKKLFIKNGFKIKAFRYYGEYPSSKLRFDFFKNRLMIVVTKK